MDQVKFVEDSALKNWSDMVCLKKLYITSKFLKAVLHKFYIVHFWIHRPK